MKSRQTLVKGIAELAIAVVSFINFGSFAVWGETVEWAGSRSFTSPCTNSDDIVITATGGFDWSFTPGSADKTGDYVFEGTVSALKSSGSWDLRRAVTSDNAHKIIFKKAVNAPNVQLDGDLNMNWTVQFLDAVTLRRTHCGYWNNNMSAWFEFYKDACLKSVTPARQVRIRAKADNVFTNHPPVIFDCSIESGKSAGSYYNGLFDMDGHNLIMDRIEHDSSLLGGLSGEFFSASGAPTLRLEGTASATTTALIRDKISLVWAPKTTGLKQTFKNRVQTTSGTITVTNGVLATTGAGSWKNVTEIRIEQDGEFTLDTTAIAALSGVKKITVAGNGKLTVTQGSALFGTCSLDLSEGARVALPDGSYGFNGVTTNGVKLAGSYSSDPTSEDYLPQLVGNFTILCEKRVCTWTGAAGDGLWSTDHNWADDLVPNRDCDVTLKNTDDDFEIVNDIENLRVNTITFSGAKPFRLSGQKLRLNSNLLTANATAIVTNAVDIVLPKGTTAFEHSNGKRLYLAGAFSCTAGSATLNLNSASESSLYTLAGSNTIDKIYAARELLIANPGVLPAGATLQLANGYSQFAKGGDHLYDIVFTCSGSMEFRVNEKNGVFKFRGRISAEKITDRFYLVSDCVNYYSAAIHFYGEVYVPKGLYFGRVRDSSSIHFHAPATFGSIGGGDWAASSGCQTHFYSTNTTSTLCPAYSLWVVTRAPDVFPYVPVSFDMAAAAGTSRTSGLINMMGNDQVFDRIYTTKAESASSAHGQIYSDDKMAKLTLRGTASARTSVAIDNKVSLFWCPTNATYVQSFTNRVHSMVGTLAVSNGILEVSGTSTFAKARDIVVMSNGVFRLTSTAANALASVTNITVLAGGALEVAEGVSTPITAGTPTLTLETGASVTIPSTASYTFKWAEKDGWTLAKGTYTSANLPELKAGTIVTLKHKPHAAGLIYFVR